MISFLSEHLDFFLTAVAFLGAILLFGRRLGQWEGRLQEAVRSIRTLMDSYNFLVGALVKVNVLEADRLLDVMDPFSKLSRGSLDRLLAALSPSGNPISQEQVDRLKVLVAKGVREKALPYEEAIEGYELAKAIEVEFPDMEGAQSIKSFFAYMLGQASAEPVT